MKIDEYFSKLSDEVETANTYELSGKVSQITGQAVESDGPRARLGDLCQIYGGGDSVNPIMAEVVGFRRSKLLLMPYGKIAGIGLGDRVVTGNREFEVAVGEEMKGRVLDALGVPIDDKGYFKIEAKYKIDNDPPNPLDRKRIHQPFGMGVRAIDGFLTIGRGQRVGIFAGSGVGKSTLLGMIARSAVAEVNVIVLIGERGREVIDFIEKDLQEHGLKKSVLVVATSDQPALLRLKSAMVGTAIAEYFRDRGKDVLLMMDSLTRFAMAQREIGMAVGEPPVSHGFPPSVFAKLPRLLERSGTSSKGSITAVYTVLVEGDDINEPISDTVRGILDGHIVLSRDIANNNHYPPIDVLQSVSRLMPDVATKEHYNLARELKGYMAAYNDAKDLISIGAYKSGANPQLDKAVAVRPKINEVLKQDMAHSSTMDEAVKQMKAVVGK